MFKNKTVLTIGILILLATGSVFVFHRSAQAFTFTELMDDEVYLTRGDLENIRAYELFRVSITIPGVIDIVEMEDDKILIIGRNAGDTTLYIWDRYGKRTIDIHVADRELGSVKTRIENLMEKDNLKGIDLEIDRKEGKIIATGEVSPTDLLEFERIIDPFFMVVMNLVKQESTNDLVQIDAQITELTGTYSETLGIDWTDALTYNETVPSGHIENFGNIFKLGDFARSTAIQTTLNALVNEGKARVLSRPKLVVRSGRDANFLVGGEVPIVTTSISSSGASQQDVTFKDYGVGIDIQPTIYGKDAIELNLNIEVSDIDRSTNYSGQPAFTTRNTETSLYVKENETIVIAGLIKENRGETLERVPFLSDIPVVGLLFRKKTRSNDTDTELVITISPSILRQGERESYSNEYPLNLSLLDERLEPPVYAKGEEIMMPGRIRPVQAVLPQSGKKVMTPRGISGMEQPVYSVTIPSELMPYARAVQRKIARRIIYPSQARELGLSGTVKLSLHLKRDGSLSTVRVQESSGHELFDQDALNLVKELSPYDGFPKKSGFSELTLSIPIVYRLDQ